MNSLELASYLDVLLDIAEIQDSANAVNGLQVQNKGDIKKIGLAVDACLATIAMAKDTGCQMMFVHHGLFWGGNQPLRGKHFEKIAMLIENDIALYSAHLPLDMHPALGNNRALADLIGLEGLEPFGVYSGQKIGLKGTLPALPASELKQRLEERLGARVLLAGDRTVQSVGLVTGGAGDILRQAVEEGLDCYITGEGGNHNFHEAEEGDCALLLAGHYATETGGIKSVGKHLKERFGTEFVFLDYPTGM